MPATEPETNAPPAPIQVPKELRDYLLKDHPKDENEIPTYVPCREPGRVSPLLLLRPDRWFQAGGWKFLVDPRDIIQLVHGDSTIASGKAYTSGFAILTSTGPMKTDKDPCMMGDIIETDILGGRKVLVYNMTCYPNEGSKK